MLWEEAAGGNQRQAASRALSVFCYLGKKELGRIINKIKKEGLLNVAA